MPIPQMRQSKKHQPWRNNKKKYYLSRNSQTEHTKKGGRFNFLKNKKFSPQFKKRFILMVIGLFLLGVMVLIIMLAWLSRGLPSPDSLIEREIAQSTTIYDRTGEQILYEIHGDEQRSMVNIDEIPEYIKWATIAIEDKNFYKHRGISLWGIFRGVVWQQLQGKRAGGGSTLTQQFVKNAILTNERTIIRKVKEWLLAYKIEKRYSKNEILQMYFNEIPYGSTAYGVEAASRMYFGKSARDITLAEAAVLAALPQGPTKYSPYGPNINLLLGRQKYILDLMVDQQYITAEEAETAKTEEIIFNKQNIDIKAPHFVMMIKEQLSEKYGQKVVEQGGLKIYTTLDLYKQQIAEEVITEISVKNEERWQATNASLVSIDPKNGQVLAMVGSKDYFNDEIDGQVNISTSNRQPGSSMKPMVYAASFIKGYTPNTVLYDVVTNFSNDPNKPYEPHNYDNKEHGPVTIRKALAGSLNIPAVKAIYLAGVNNVLDLVHELGYSTLEDRDRFGLSLVLGGGEVKLLEHTNAFSAFAREGYLKQIVTILKVEDADGSVLEEYEEKEPKKVLDPKIARAINNILSDNNARAYAFGESNWLTLDNRPVAAKTGTTNDYRDAWTIGYTPSIVTGVWVGNNDNSEMKRGAAGGTVAAPIWHDYMQKILGDTPIEYFKEPEIKETGKAVLDGKIGLETIVKIDRATGLLATEYTPASFVEEKIYSEPHSILYFVDINDPLGNQPQNPEKDPQFKLWESRVLEWATKQMASSSAELITNEKPPTEYDNIHTPENLPSLRVVIPENNETITQPLLISRVSAEAKRNINRVEYYINENLIYVAYSYPWSMEKRIDFLSNGYYNLKIRACDDVDNCSSQEREINLILASKPQQKDIALSINSPQSGLAISNIDFPLLVDLSVNEPDQVAKILIKLQTENNEPIIISTIQPVESNNLFFSWPTIPLSGTYSLSAEAISWSNKKYETEKTILIVNNVANPESIE